MAKVMLIEDDPTMLSLLNTLLEIEGFEVAQLDTFDNIVEDVRVNAPDVILMDVHLHDIVIIFHHSPMNKIIIMPLVFFQKTWTTD